MNDDRTNYLSLGIIAFFGSIVANIIFPERRGVAGFASATVVGIACGCTAGMTALAYEVHPGTQLVVTFSVGMLSYRILNAVFMARRDITTINNNIQGMQQQNINQQGGEADAHVSGLDRYGKRTDTDK